MRPKRRGKELRHLTQKLCFAETFLFALETKRPHWAHCESGFAKAAHGTGLCRPCAWLWKPGGCQNGMSLKVLFYFLQHKSAMASSLLVMAS